MNPGKKDYNNSWILCPSTRIPGKFYYFNVVTGEAVWSLNDIERGMVERSNFTPTGKWHSYPEPECPPPHSPLNSWNYQPGPVNYRMYQPMPSFGQVVFPKYTTNVGTFPSNAAWPSMQMQHPMYSKPPMINMTFEPSWPSYSSNNTKFHEKNQFTNNLCNMKSFNSFNQVQNRPVFHQKSNHMNNAIFCPQMDNQSGSVFQKRPASMEIENGYKESNFKKMKTQEPVQEIAATNYNIFRTKFNKITAPEENANNVPKKICNCMLEKTQKKLQKSSRFQENTTMINKQNQTEKVAILKDNNSKFGKTDCSQSDVSSDFSMKGSFVFPIKHSDTKTVSSKSSLNLNNNLLKMSQNATGEQKRNAHENLEGNLSNTDLRHILMAKKMKSTSGASIATKTVEAKSKTKIRTSRSESKATEEPPKKRVTFSLGVEGASEMSDEFQNDDAFPSSTKQLEVDANGDEIEAGPYCVVVDADVLLTEFALVEKFVQSEEGYSLVIPASVKREIEAVGATLGGDRRQTLVARKLLRTLKEPPAYLTVQSENTEAEKNEKEDPVINCCIQLLEKGLAVMLITNSEDLYNYSISIDVECYTTEDIKYLASPKPEISFDLKKIHSTETDDIRNNVTVSCNRKQLFKDENFREHASSQDIIQAKIKRMIPSNASSQDIIQAKIKRMIPSNASSQDIIQANIKTMIPSNASSQDIIQANIKRMIPSKNYTKKIDTHFEKLKLDETSVCRSQQTQAENKAANNKKQNYFLLKNGADDNQNGVTKNYKENRIRAAKNKFQYINIYNLNELLNNFCVSTTEVEKRIVTRMDEYFCCFTQIMEDILGGILKCSGGPGPGALTNSPLQELLLALREVYSDHRTIKALTDKLCKALECKYAIKGDSKIVSMSPDDFVKTLGCGILLVKSLMTIIPDSRVLEEAEDRLDYLTCHIEEELQEEPVAPPVLCSGEPHSPRANFVRNPGEVLEYLQKHYPEWSKYRATKTTEKNTTEVQTKPATKVIRTLGKHISRLEFKTRTSMVLHTNDDNENITIKKNDKETNENGPKEDKTEITGAKLLKTLTLQSQNLPPKMKEIDVEKRENVNKEMLNMLDQMITAKPQTKQVTRFYDLENIIITKNVNGVTDKDKNYSKNKVPEKEVKIIKTKESVNQNGKRENKENSLEKTEKHNVEKAKTREELNHLPNIQTKEPLDLDVLDYSDLCHGVEDMERDEPEKSSMLVLDAVNYNDVTTTQNSNEEIDGNNHDLDLLDINTDNVEDLDIDNNNNDSNGNNDSGIESQTYSLIQVFLVEITRKFKTIHQFIQTSVRRLRSRKNEQTKTELYDIAAGEHATVLNIIATLKGIVERESCLDQSIVTPLLQRTGSAAASDERILNYRGVISKLLEQARVLDTLLKNIQKVCRDDFDLASVSDLSSKYTQLFK